MLTYVTMEMRTNWRAFRYERRCTKKGSMQKILSRRPLTFSLLYTQAWGRKNKNFMRHKVLGRPI